MIAGHASDQMMRIISTREALGEMVEMVSGAEDRVLIDGHRRSDESHRRVNTGRFHARERLRSAPRVRASRPPSGGAG
jgi:hypothetical protein